MKVRKTFSLMTDGLFLLLFVYLLVFPKYAAEPMRRALEFCGNTLIPSLFIYMVLAKPIMSFPITEKICNRIGPAPMMLLLGTLCGCPIGAKTAFDLYKKGAVSKKQAEYLCSFTNNASISFLLGYVGTELFGDIRIGLKILVYQLISSEITAIVMKHIMFGKEKLLKADIGSSARIGLREAVSDSALTMLDLTACVCFFMVAGGVLVNILSLPAPLDAALKSVLEFSSGCAAASKTGIYALPLTAFSIGLTGGSVAMQVRSVTKGQLSMKPYLTGKIISCAVMTCLAVIFG